MVSIGHSNYDRKRHYAGFYELSRFLRYQIYRMSSKLPRIQAFKSKQQQQQNATNVYQIIKMIYGFV